MTTSSTKGLQARKEEEGLSNTNTKNRETTTTTAIMSGGIGGQKSSESSPLIIKAPGVVTENHRLHIVSKDLKLFENGGGKKDDDDDAEKNAASAAVEDKEEAQPANKAAMNFMMDDSELTEEQQRVIAERVAALQNRFKKFEEKSTENKRDELVMQHGHLNLNANEATMILKSLRYERTGRGGTITPSERFISRSGGNLGRVSGAYFGHGNRTVFDANTRHGDGGRIREEDVAEE